MNNQEAPETDTQTDDPTFVVVARIDGFVDYQNKYPTIQLAHEAAVDHIESLMVYTRSVNTLGWTIEIARLDKGKGPIPMWVRLVAQYNPANVYEEDFECQHDETGDI